MSSFVPGYDFDIDWLESYKQYHMLINKIHDINRNVDNNRNLLIEQLVMEYPHNTFFYVVSGWNYEQFSDIILVIKMTARCIKYCIIFDDVNIMLCFDDTGQIINTKTLKPKYFKHIDDIITDLYLYIADNVRLNKLISVINRLRTVSSFPDGLYELNQPYG